MKFSIDGIAMSVVLALASAGGVTLASAQTRSVPLPPAQAGCYRFINAEWIRTACDSAEYIESHIPRPEVELGIGETSSDGTTPSHFNTSTVRVDQFQLGAEKDVNRLTGLPEHGPDAYSIQVNIGFIGKNGAQDGVQFTNQAEPAAGVFMNNVCVWQIDVATQTYTPACISLPFSSILNQVEGVNLGHGLLASFATLDGDGPVAVIIVPDLYDLASSDRWNNVTGGLLGYGGGSEAQFSGKSGIARESISAATCINKDPLSTFVFDDIQCSESEQLDGRADLIVSPSAATSGISTVETTNLEPVTKDPKVTFPNAWAAELRYAWTPTGKCPGDTKAPLCE
jgi:hypothetical protein